MQTFGWGLVIACSVETVNDQLSKNMDQMPATFSGQETADGNTNKISGTFGTWSLVSGGSNQDLHFWAPITSGQLTLGAGTKDETSFDLSGVCPVISLRLAFIDGPGDSNVKNLTFDTTGVSIGGGDSSQLPVTLITPDAGAALAKVDPYHVASGTLGRLLPLCLSENRDKLKFVFGQLNMVPTDPRLKPRDFNYLYAEGPEIGDSGDHSAGYLVVLAQVDDQPASAINVDPQLLVYDENFSKPERVVALHGRVFMMMANLRSLRWPDDLDGQSGLQVQGGSLGVNDDHVEATLHIKANWKDGAFWSADVDLTATVKSFPNLNGNVVVSDQISTDITGTMDPQRYSGDFGDHYAAIKSSLTQQAQWSLDLASLPWAEQLTASNPYFSGELMAVRGSLVVLEDGGIQ
jgi:hypothetical protein